MNSLTLNREHFLPTELPKSVLAAIKTVEAYDESLAFILKEELKAGNTINQVRENWPAPGEIAVVLAHPFQRTYFSDNITYEELDLHNGTRHYRSNVTGHSLIH